MRRFPRLSRAPELNPVENVRQFLRGNRLSRKVFRSYDQIVDLCCQALGHHVNRRPRSRPWVLINAEWHETIGIPGSPVSFVSYRRSRVPA